MRILYVLEYFYPHVGGVETLFDKLTAELSAAGHDITILTSKLPRTKRFDISKGRKIYRFDARFRHAFLFSFLKAARLARNADIVHTSTFVAAGAAWLAKKLVKFPMIVTFHEVWGKLFFEFQNPLSASINYVLEDALCRACKNEILTCPSRATKEAMVAKGMRPKNIHVIPNGIDHKIFNPRVRAFRKWKFPTYLCYGRAGISKGIEYLIDAVPLIVKEIPQAKLVLMLSRDGKYSEIMRKVERFRKHIILLKPRKDLADVAAVIRSCDVVVVPSVSEGFGLAAIEPQACGVPVVASRAASLPEVVRGGILVQPRSPEAIATAVVKLLNERALRTKLARAGIKYVKKYSFKNTIASFLKLYESLI